MKLNSRIKRIFWKIDDDEKEIVWKRSEKPFENFQVGFDDERVNKAVSFHNRKWFHNELVVKCTDAIVEPQYGYAVSGLRTIVGASIRTRNNLPSPLPVLIAKMTGSTERMRRAVLFDGSMGINYFHFLSDVLHKVYLLQKLMTIDCPLLIGENVYKKPFFQYLIHETSLSGYVWKPLTRPVLAKELYVARPMPYERSYWLRTKALFIQGDALPNHRHAIFVNRTGTRHITNFDEILPILSTRGVEVVDPGRMNVREQAALFNSATHVIGLHGAGMTNVAFCNHQKVKVLELCSNNRIGTQYYWLCTALGIGWDMMLGGTAKPDQSFELDPEAFSLRLDNLLSN